MMDEIFNFIGKIIAYGGGAATLAYVIFMFLGKKWIEAKFEEKLEAFKHAQEQELERYRHQVNVLFSRVTKIHEKEIDILPEMWRKLQDALGYVAGITSPIQYPPPPLEFMNQEDLQEFLSKSRLSEADKKTLAASKDKNAFYNKTIFWYNLDDAKSSVREFHNFMLYNRIFLSQDLKLEFEAIDKLLSSVLINRETGERAKDWNLIAKTYKDLEEKSKVIVARIEKSVQDRLEFARAKSS